MSDTGLAQPDQVDEAENSALMGTVIGMSVALVYSADFGFVRVFIYLVLGGFLGAGLGRLGHTLSGKP